MEHHTFDIGGRIRWAAIAAAAVTTFTIGAAAVASSGDAAGTGRLLGAPSAAAPADPYSTCLQAGSTAADRIEARVQQCRLITQALYKDPAFIECVRTSAGTPDAMLHWMERCRILTQR